MHDERYRSGRPEPKGSLRPADPPRRTVLVLGGGGMRGYCHIGVIRAIERLGLHVDEVVGTSMGAVMGGLFASGMDSRRIEEVASQISFKDYFRLNLLKFLVKGYRHASVYKGRTFHEFLRRWLPQQHFADLPRPFFCNALSLKTGKSRFFGLPGADDVPVGDAVYASACLPAVFEPMELDGDHYIDGGMTETLGLRLAKARSPDLVIAVDLSHRDLHAEMPYRASLPHILSQTYEMMGMALNEQNLHRYVDDKTVLIKPKVSHIGLLDMPDVSEIVRLGEREALLLIAVILHVVVRGAERLGEVGFAQDAEDAQRQGCLGPRVIAVRVSAQLLQVGAHERHFEARGDALLLGELELQVAGEAAALHEHDLPLQRRQRLADHAFQECVDERVNAIAGVERPGSHAAHHSRARGRFPSW